MTGEQMFEAEEIRLILANSQILVKAMVLLGINCGFGNSDCSELALKDVDIRRGWIDQSRHKTLVKRRCPLWPETVVALREATQATFR